MTENRRDVSTRKLAFFPKNAQRLVRWGLKPNHISILSSVFALIAGVAMIAAGPRPLSQNLVLLFIAFFCIQLRLACNLFDGLMAVEGGLKTPTGELYNDVPDRLSDVFIILGAGYSAGSHVAHMIELSWAAALLAVFTAYIRVLGGAMKTKYYFIGPMAKQHRMFIINVSIIGTAIEACIRTWGYSFSAAIIIIGVGSLLTCVRRLKAISRDLNRPSLL